MSRGRCNNSQLASEEVVGESCLKETVTDLAVRRPRKDQTVSSAPAGFIVQVLFVLIASDATGLSASRPGILQTVRQCAARHSDSQQQTYRSPKPHRPTAEIRPFATAVTMSAPEMYGRYPVLPPRPYLRLIRIHPSILFLPDIASNVYSKTQTTTE
jgi:hypothetical protein